MIKRCPRLLGCCCCWRCVAVNTLRQGSRQLSVPPLPPLAVDEAGAAASLAAAIRMRTESSAHRPGRQCRPVPARCTPTWQQRYPKAHAALKRELVGRLEPALHLARQRPGGQAHPADGAPGRGADRAGHREELAGRAPLPARSRTASSGAAARGTTRPTWSPQMEAVEMLLAGGLQAASAPSTWPSAPTRRSAACAAPSRSPRCCSNASVKLRLRHRRRPADHRRHPARPGQHPRR